MALPRRHPPPTPVPLATRGQTQLLAVPQFRGTCNGSVGCVTGSGRGRVDTLAIQISFIIANALRGLLDCFAYHRNSCNCALPSPLPPFLPSLPSARICYLNIRSLCLLHLLAAAAGFQLQYLHSNYAAGSAAKILRLATRAVSRSLPHHDCNRWRLPGNRPTGIAASNQRTGLARPTISSCCQARPDHTRPEQTRPCSSRSPRWA